MTTTVATKGYRALSLGAGVQSSVLALLLSRSDPRLAELGYTKPDAAIFADTGWEPDYVYSHLDWLEKQLDYPLIRVSDGDLKTNVKQGLTVSGHHFVDVPFFVVDGDGKKGMLRRQCTNHYKIRLSTGRYGNVQADSAADHSPRIPASKCGLGFHWMK